MENYLPSPVTLNRQEQHAIVLLGGSEAEVRNALVALDGSLLIQVQEDGIFVWRFKHPTIRDAFAELVAANRELLDIYITGTPIPRLFQEISCGDVGLEGVKVMVPHDRYGVVLSRIQAFATESRENRNHVNGFLSRRCDQGFLSVFTSINPNFIEDLYVGSYLYAVSDVGIIIRLHEFGLLPEAERLRHVAAIRDLAVEIPDAGFLRQDVRSLLTKKEFCEILDHVRANLISDLDSCVEVWRENYTAGDDPDEYFSELKAALTELRNAFCEDPSAVALIDGGLATADEAIEALRDQVRVERGREGYHDARAHRGQSDGSRSIFDDVDQ